MYIGGSVLCRSALIKSKGRIHNNMVGICRSECWLCAVSSDLATEPLILFLFVGATSLLSVSASLFLCSILLIQDFSVFVLRNQPTNEYDKGWVQGNQPHHQQQLQWNSTRRALREIRPITTLHLVRVAGLMIVHQVVEELKKMGDIGLPIAAMSLATYFKNMVMVVSMGRLGSLELAGGAFAIGVTNITGYSVLSGLAMGMEPICSQAFGSRNHLVASLTLQRTILMLLLASIPICLLWINLEPLLLALHQEPDITRIASLFCRFTIPDLVANSILYPLRIYLRSKGTTWPLMWCTFISIIFHVPITIFLAFTLNLGVLGIAISTFISNFATILLLFFVTFLDQNLDHQITNSLSTPLQSQVVSIKYSNSSSKQEWGTLIRLAIPSCISVCLEWSWYEFMTILAGYLINPRVALATAAILIQTTSLMYTLPTALSASVSIRVGNELGAGRPDKARLVTVIAIALALLGSFFGFVGITLGREGRGRVFTSDHEVLELTMVVLPIVGVCELANCPQTTSCGILRGSARPGIGVGINFYSFYLVGAPIATLLAFVWRMGFVGPCYRLLAAQMACVVSILTVVYYTDWERESVKAKELMMGSNN